MREKREEEEEEKGRRGKKERRRREENVDRCGKDWVCLASSQRLVIATVRTDKPSLREGGGYREGGIL